MYVFPLFFFSFWYIYSSSTCSPHPKFAHKSNNSCRESQTQHKVAAQLLDYRFFSSSRPFCVPKTKKKTKKQQQQQQKKTGKIFFFYRLIFCLCFSCVPVNKLNSRKLPVSLPVSSISFVVQKILEGDINKSTKIAVVSKTIGGRSKLCALLNFFNHSTIHFVVLFSWVKLASQVSLGWCVQHCGRPLLCRLLRLFWCWSLVSAIFACEAGNKKEEEAKTTGIYWSKVGVQNTTEEYKGPRKIYFSFHFLIPLGDNRRVCLDCLVREWLSNRFVSFYHEVEKSRESQKKKGKLTILCGHQPKREKDNWEEETQDGTRRE